MKSSALDCFCQLKLNSNLIGLEKTDGEDCFCVPNGAKIFAALGVDGVQFCFIDGFGEMVFAISPNALNGRCVNPLSYTFLDFLSLVISCKNANPIEQIYWQSKTQFYAFLQEDISSATEEQNAVIEQLQKELRITPFADPYEYVRNVQTTFDYSEIRFTAEYYDTLGLPR